VTAFAELCITTNFSFLRSGSHPEEMVVQAKAIGLAGIGVADRNTLAGVVRAHIIAKEEGLRLIVGARLVFTDGAPDIIAYPEDRAAYAQLTRVLTKGNLRAPKGECHLRFEDLLEHADGLQCIVVPADDSHTFVLLDYLRPLRAACGQVWLAAPFRFDGEDRRRLCLLKAMAQETGARLLATTEPLMHHPSRRALLDVVTCIREKKRLADAGLLLAKNAERHLKPPQEMLRLYSRSSARAAARRPIRPSASPRHHRGRSPKSPTFSSSASSPPSATSRPTSTSISSTSGARR
jgi:error-prone DNA polymerase